MNYLFDIEFRPRDADTASLKPRTELKMFTGETPSVVLCTLVMLTSHWRNLPGSHDHSLRKSIQPGILVMSQQKRHKKGNEMLVYIARHSSSSVRDILIYPQFAYRHKKISEWANHHFILERNVSRTRLQIITLTVYPALSRNIDREIILTPYKFNSRTRL